jgi:hypothetical protein
MFRRVWKNFRYFSDKFPSKPNEIVEKEQEAIKELKKEDLEVERKDFKEYFPNPNQIVERKHVPQYISSFGKSDEEEIEPFFIEDLNEFQYSYTPLKELIFDESGYALIYQAKKRSFLLPFKLKYCWKLIFPLIFNIIITLQGFVHNFFGIILAWTFPFVMYSKGLVVRSIKLNQDGKTLKVTYKRFKFSREKEVTVSIDTFKEPSGDSFIIWSLYEFPDDLKTFMETENIERVTFAKYWGNWSFFMITREPEIINREILVNAMNGIFIDTSKLGGEELSSRYSILHSKKK